MFTKTNRNDPLVESIKNVMEQNDILRRVETAVNEHFGVVSKKALPHEYHAEYDELFEETKKCAMAEEDKSKKADTPEHHRAEAIRAHKAIKVSGKLPHLVARKKDHEEAYKKMTGNKIKYPDDLDEKVEMTKAQMANLDGDPKFTGNDLKHLRAGTHKKKAAAGTLEEKAPPGAKFERMVKHIKKSEEDKPEEVKKRIAYATAWKQYKKQKMNEQTSIDSVVEEIRNNLEEQLVHVYENYDEASFSEFVNSLSEEELNILDLHEQGTGVHSSGVRAVETLNRVYTANSNRNNSLVRQGANVIKNTQAQKDAIDSGKPLQNLFARSTKETPSRNATPAQAQKFAAGGGDRLAPGYKGDTSKPIPNATQAQVQRIATGTGDRLAPGYKGNTAKPLPSTANRPQRPVAASTANRPQRPVAASTANRPQRPARPMDKTSTGDIMNRSLGIREEQNKIEKPIKESFEQFLRNKFMRD